MTFPTKSQHSGGKQAGRVRCTVPQSFSLTPDGPQRRKEQRGSAFCPAMAKAEARRGVLLHPKSSIMNFTIL